MTPEEERLTWQFRAIHATQGNKTLLGAVLLSVLGRVASNPPTWGMTAVIRGDGLVLSNFRSKQNPGVWTPAPVGQIGQLVDEFRQLADVIKATDAEREDMFKQLRMWFTHDYRALLDRDHLVL